MGERESAESWNDDVSGDLVWVPGLDYMPEWLDALEAAAEVNAALVAAGLERGALWAVAGTDDEGRGMVRLRGTPAGARSAAMLLRRGLG